MCARVCVCACMYVATPTYCKFACMASTDDTALLLDADELNQEGPRSPEEREVSEEDDAILLDVSTPSSISKRRHFLGSELVVAVFVVAFDTKKGEGERLKCRSSVVGSFSFAIPFIQAMWWSGSFPKKWTWTGLSFEPLLVGFTTSTVISCEKTSLKYASIVVCDCVILCVTKGRANTAQHTANPFLWILRSVHDQPGCHFVYLSNETGRLLCLLCHFSDCCLAGRWKSNLCTRPVKEQQ